MNIMHQRKSIKWSFLHKYRNCLSVHPKENDNTVDDVVEINHQSNETPTVLIVEDNRITQMEIVFLLEQFNCIVDIAENGENAVALLKTNQYDLVFMDIGLPDINGYDVTCKIREWEKHNNLFTPIVALVAYCGDKILEQCLSVGMQEVIIKPLINEHIQELLDKFVFNANLTLP